MIRIFSGKRAQGPERGRGAERLAIEGIEECCDYAGKHGVYLALENHGGLTATVDGILAIVREACKEPLVRRELSTRAISRSATPYDDLASSHRTP